VDEDISEKEIMEFIESEYEVLSIRRLSNRRNKDLVTQDPKWIPSRSVVIIFSDQKLT